MNSVNQGINFGPHYKSEKVKTEKSIANIHQRMIELSKKIYADDIEYQPTEIQMKIYHSATTELKKIRQDMVKIAKNKLSLPLKEKLSRDLFDLNQLEKKLLNPKIRNLSISTFMKDQKLENVDENVFQKAAYGILKIIYDKISELIFRGSKKDKLNNSRYSKEMNLLTDELNKLKAAKDRIVLSLGSSESFEKMQKQIRHIDSKMETLIEKIEILKKTNKGKVTREAMKEIGGEVVKIIDEATSDVLDGMYLSADRFREVLKNAGGCIATFEEDGEVIEALSFPESKYKDLRIQRNLDQLGIHQIDFNVQTVNGNVYFLKGGDKKNADLVKTKKPTFREIELDKKSNGGTVLLTSCNIGNYEMHKKEMLAYLFRGINVMGCNFAGYGASEGSPSPLIVNRNIEAFYQHLKLHHPVEDQKIMLKALCMSGGPATYLAARHPNVNLFLDQTYADFAQAIGDVIESDLIGSYLDEIVEEQEDAQSIKQSIREWCKMQIDHLAHSVGELIAPSWKTEEEIKKIQGNVGLLYTTNDEYFAYEDSVKRNVAAIEGGGLAKNVKVYSMPGDHATSWATTKATRATLDDETFQKSMSYWSEEWKLTQSNQENPFKKCRIEFPLELAKYLENLPEGWDEKENFYQWIDGVSKKWFGGKSVGRRDISCEEIGGIILKQCTVISEFNVGCRHMDDFLHSIQIEGNFLC